MPTLNDKLRKVEDQATQALFLLKQQQGKMSQALDKGLPEQFQAINAMIGSDRKGLEAWKSASTEGLEDVTKLLSATKLEAKALDTRLSKAEKFVEASDQKADKLSREIF